MTQTSLSQSPNDTTSSQDVIEIKTVTRSVGRKATITKEELFQAFPAHNFEIMSHQRLEIPITLNTIDDLALFGIEGTWFLNSVAIQMLPKNFLINRMKRLFSKIFTCLRFIYL